MVSIIFQYLLLDGDFRLLVGDFGLKAQPTDNSVVTVQSLHQAQRVICLSSSLTAPSLFQMASSWKSEAMTYLQRDLKVTWPAWLLLLDLP